MAWAAPHQKWGVVKASNSHTKTTEFPKHREDRIEIISRALFLHRSMHRSIPARPRTPLNQSKDAAQSNHWAPFNPIRSIQSNRSSHAAKPTRSLDLSFGWIERAPRRRVAKRLLLPLPSFLRCLDAQHAHNDAALPPHAHAAPRTPHAHTRTGNPTLHPRAMADEKVPAVKQHQAPEPAPTAAGPKKATATTAATGKGKGGPAKPAAAAAGAAVPTTTAVAEAAGKPSKSEQGGSEASKGGYASESPSPPHCSTPPPGAILNSHAHSAACRCALCPVRRGLDAVHHPC